MAGVAGHMAERRGLVAWHAWHVRALSAGASVTGVEWHRTQPTSACVSCRKPTERASGASFGTSMLTCTARGAVSSPS
jgi:hypothetical protein